MKIKLLDTQEIGTLSTGETLENHKARLISIVDEPHNIRYSHAEDNCLYFQIMRFPYKEMLKIAAAQESGAVSQRFQKSYIRAVIHSTETVLHFLFRYTVQKVERHNPGELSRRSVAEKQIMFLMEANKDEIIRLVDPFLVDIENVNIKSAAAKYIQSYNDWAHPLTLEAVTAGLTDEQKLKAAKIIRELFGIAA